MMRVLCVKWGKKYDSKWVTRLRGMVAAGLDIPHKFQCVTDVPIPGVDCIPFISDLPGWWAKVELLAPGRFPGDNLYLDLDVVITGKIEKLVRCLDGDRSRLWALDDFSYSLANPKCLGDDAKRILGGDGTINSSVMMWHGDAAKQAWTQFDPEYMKVLHGDQNWITKALWPDKINLIPPGVVRSYRYHALNDSLRDAPVTVFHGIPKMDELPPRDPLRQIWEAA